MKGVKRVRCNIREDLIKSGYSCRNTVKDIAFNNYTTESLIMQLYDMSHFPLTFKLSLYLLCLDEASLCTYVRRDTTYCSISG